MDDNASKNKTLPQVYFYAITGQKLATYQISADGKSFSSAALNLYFGGKLIRSAGKTVATDRLGSVRASVTTNGGNLQSMSYWPYGLERTSTADGIEKFGTYFRDMPGQDYADQRYYNGTLGRFWTPDPSESVNLASPSTWNQYAYVHGDPVNFNDPGGMLEYCPACGIYQDMIGTDIVTITPTLLDPFWGNQIASQVSAQAVIASVNHTVLWPAAQSILESAAEFVSTMSFSEDCWKGIGSIMNSSSDNPTRSDIQLTSDPAKKSFPLPPTISRSSLAAFGSDYFFAGTTSIATTRRFA